MAEKLYVLFNVAECLTWIGIGLWLGAQVIQNKHEGALRQVVIALSCAFILFGLSDYAESYTDAKLPWWLWMWKIIIGLSLFALLLRYDYLKRGSIALAWWRFAGAALILGLAIYAILHQR